MPFDILICFFELLEIALMHLIPLHFADGMQLCRIEQEQQQRQSAESKSALALKKAKQLQKQYERSFSAYNSGFDLKRDVKVHTEMSVHTLLQKACIF